MSKARKLADKSLCMNSVGGFFFLLLFTKGVKHFDKRNLKCSGILDRKTFSSLVIELFLFVVNEFFSFLSFQSCQAKQTRAIQFFLSSVLTMVEIRELKINQTKGLRRILLWGEQSRRLVWFVNTFFLVYGHINYKSYTLDWHHLTLLLKPASWCTNNNDNKARQGERRQSTTPLD